MPLNYTLSKLANKRLTLDAFSCLRPHLMVCNIQFHAMFRKLHIEMKKYYNVIYFYRTHANLCSKIVCDNYPIETITTRNSYHR